MTHVSELGRIIVDKARSLDPRPVVRQEAANSRDLRTKFEKLLNGQRSNLFWLKEPFYSATLWKAPARVEVFSSEFGFNLAVQTAGAHTHGEGVRLNGNGVEVYDISFVKPSAGRKMHDSVDPWEVARGIIDRVIMATSDDPKIQEQYRAMRQKEQKDHEDSQAALASTYDYY